MSFSEINEHQTPSSTEELPVLRNLSPSRPSSRKERGVPSVTPRKFKKFFTPQCYGSAPTSRSALIEITTFGSNRTTLSSPLRPFRNSLSQDSSALGYVARESKRRKVYNAIESEKEIGLYGASHGGGMSSPCERAVKSFGDTDSESESEEEDVLPQPVPAKRIVRIEGRGLSGQLLRRSIGSNTRQRYAYPINDWRDHTANFYSSPQDVHVSRSLMPQHQDQQRAARTIPFCVRGLNREDSTLVALADEEGHVRILESAKDGQPSFKESLFHDRIHSNAIIDMVFSNDDSRLATSSGDQTARIYDMHTKATLSILGCHTASLKQVRWQPGPNNNNILATSSRDGSIAIWDLRCNTSMGPTFPIYVPAISDPASESTTIVCNRQISCINNAHKTQTRVVPVVGSFDQVIRPGEKLPRTGDVSVTAIQFLPAGREHLLLSGSEADASVKLWDIRQTISKFRQGALASTTPPQSHSKFRSFGINSLNLNSDGSRFYTLCKDNTVYAYSTEHLMLGQAPELSYAATTRPSVPNTHQHSLGPLYGFRHPKLHASTFYVKSEMRKAQHGRCEMLAVGSSDSVPILFPTDERYLPNPEKLLTSDASPALIEARPALRKVINGNSHMDGSLLISTNGTALVRGHDREVSSLTWTSAGDLVTVGDDYLVRCWREDHEEAKSLRLRGEHGGRRWASGWADVPADYDVEQEVLN